MPKAGEEGQRTALVTGAGGFIGHHLVKHLKSKGYWVRGVDVHEPHFEPTSADEYLILDLRKDSAALTAVTGTGKVRLVPDEVYQLSANMGGMGFIQTHHSEILRDNLLINLNMLEAARKGDVERYLYSSSACVYPDYKQTSVNVTPLKEEDAYPADPQDAYGWEKLTSEKLCQYYRSDYGMNTHIVRFHNVFGPLGAYRDGREKAPAALCRKFAVARITGRTEIELWGDGKQTRSFLYIDDCVRGVHMLQRSEIYDPINLGQDRLISINEMADIIAAAAGIAHFTIKHIPGPQGVRGRNSDNTKVYRDLKWRPKVSLEEGLARLYRWVYARVAEDIATAEDKKSAILMLSSSETFGYCDPKPKE
ncbi:MAG: NAD-dependent epimerase/dehydratase family protein [Methanomassiliicoccales archaeon]|nr:NAD-dependent epimerase/dehydratase family protein [Methanomassiliicoccales archaeon]